jgi:glutamate-5-semialdehyde dehydrogenase
MKGETMGLQVIGKNARQAFERISRTDSGCREKAVRTIADRLEGGFAEVLAANREDVQSAKQVGLTPALIDRLTLNVERLEGIVSDLRALADLPDPVGSVYDERTLPNGIKLWRQRVPLGVLGVIYESRPNVTIDVAGLVVKTGNAAILRGGKETIQSNRVLVKIVQSALRDSDLPMECVQFIDNPDRALVEHMLRLNDYIDVIIPRGGNSLHQFCRQHATIPVITGGIGICHLYVDADANLDQALPVIYNAKTQRPSVCNALDTLLVHESIASDFLPRVVKYLSPSGVTFRAEPGAAALLEDGQVMPAGPDDFDTEWLSLVLGLKVVPDLETAIQHIHLHSTHHSDGILTGNSDHADRFVHEVDSAAVYVNASTRFTDGAQFGLGAEVAVSTQRLHARGPMGLPELTTYKWVVVGDYTYRQ